MGQGIFDRALAAHTNWVGRFHAVLIGLDRDPIDVDEVGDESRCELGLWLAEGHPSLADSIRIHHLQTVHHALHVEAARVAAELRDSNHRDDWKIDLTRFDQLSAQLVDALRAVEREIVAREGLV